MDGRGPELKAPMYLQEVVETREGARAGAQRAEQPENAEVERECVTPCQRKPPDEEGSPSAPSVRFEILAISLVSPSSLLTFSCFFTFFFHLPETGL